MRLSPAVVLLAALALPPALPGQTEAPPPAAPAAPLSPCDQKRLAVAIPGGVVPDATATAPGPLVSEIEIRSDAPLSEPALADLEELIDVTAGAPLTDAAVRSTLRNLQATGSIAQAEISTREAADGVVVLIAISPTYQVREIRLAGHPGLAAEDLKTVIPQKESQPLFEERLVRGVFNLEGLLKDNGYLKASVRLEPKVDDTTREASVTYHIESGPRAHVGTVAFSSPVDPLAPATLIGRLRSRPGELFRQEQADDDAERLRGYLLGQGYLKARVDKPVISPREGQEIVDLSFPVELGPHFTVTAIGADLAKLKRTGLLTFLGEQEFDPALLEQTQGALKAYYQGQGYYDVQVAVDGADEAGSAAALAQEIPITLRIELGSRYTLRSVKITGNQGIADQELRDLMTTAPRGRLAFLSPGKGKLVDQDLQSDLENLVSYYNRQGYGQAQIKSQVGKHGDQLDLTLQIEEGPRQRVVTLDLSQICSLPDPVRVRLQRNLKANGELYEGGPYNKVLLDETQAFLRAEYENAGFSQTQVSARQSWNADNTLVDVTLDITEGPRQVIERVIVRGNQRTDTAVIRRTARVARGEPMSTNRLRRIERDLSRLGIFSRVDVEVARFGYGTPQRDVIIRVEEAPAHALNYGVGYDLEEGVRGLLGYSDNNIFGQAIGLRGEVRLSQLNQRFRLLLDQPTLFGQPVTLTSSLFYIDADDTHFRIRRWGLRSEAAYTQTFRRSARGQQDLRRFSLAYDYRVLQLRSIDPGVALNDFERRKSRPYQISSVIPSVFLDRRDDPVDPRRGWTSLVQLQYSFPLLSADADFLKLSLQQTEHIDLGAPGVIALSLRLGGIEPFRVLRGQDPDLPDDLPSRNVFIDERFFLGGETTHRAYALDELGVLGQSKIFSTVTNSYHAVGGNGLVLGNLDYRFPLLGALGGVAFVDAGNVWADWRRIDLREAKWGAGVGLRYLSPIGPVRVEIAWKLNRDRVLEESPYRVSFSLGNPF